MDSSAEHKCRLCLQCFGPDDPPNWTVNIFKSKNTTENCSLAALITDCVGVTISNRDVPPVAICKNCERTVIFIAEFQTLCQEADRVYASLSLHCPGRGYLEEYDNLIGGLSSLIKHKRNTLAESCLYSSEHAVNSIEESESLIIENEEQFSKNEDAESDDDVWSIALVDLPDQHSPTTSKKLSEGNVNALTIDEIYPVDSSRISSVIYLDSSSDSVQSVPETDFTNSQKELVGSDFLKEKTPISQHSSLVRGSSSTRNESNRGTSTNRQQYNANTQRHIRTVQRSLYDQLREVIPTLANNPTAAKTQILDEAIQLCRRLAREQDQRDALSAQRRHLLERVRLLKKHTLLVGTNKIGKGKR